VKWGCYNRHSLPAAPSGTISHDHAASAIHREHWWTHRASDCACASFVRASERFHGWRPESNSVAVALLRDACRGLAKHNTGHDDHNIVGCDKLSPVHGTCIYHSTNCRACSQVVGEIRPLHVLTRYIGSGGVLSEIEMLQQSFGKAATFQSTQRTLAHHPHSGP
jgi:hypothetical protein